MELSYFILSTVNGEKKCRCRDETTRQHCDDTDTGKANCNVIWTHFQESIFYDWDFGTFNKCEAEILLKISTLMNNNKKWNSQSVISLLNGLA